MSARYTTRRGVVKFAGSAVALGLAGCTGSPSEPTKTAQPADEGHGSHDEDQGSHDDEGGSHDHEQRIGDAVQRAEVTMVSADDGFHFDPHVVRVEVGGAVEWTLESGSHSVTAYHPDNDRPRRVPDGTAAWDSGILSEAGATFEHTFETAGVYDYFCAPHETMGMLSSVLVGEPDPHEQPGLEAPQDSHPEAVRQKIERLNAQVNEALGHTH